MSMNMNMNMSKRTLVTMVVALIACLSMSSTSAFAPPPSLSRNAVVSQSIAQKQQSSKSTELFGRQWNFNEGRGPWGMKKNAEIWNGRAAQMGFTITLLQELVTGKGVIQGIQDGNFFNIFCLGFAVVSMVGLTGWLAFQGDDEFVDLN